MCDEPPDADDDVDPDVPPDQLVEPFDPFTFALERAEETVDRDTGGTRC